VGRGRPEQRNLDTFFEALGTERSSQLTHVTADGAEWIHTVVTKRAPKAALCLDPSTSWAWATKALDEVRRQTWNQLRSNGESRAAKTFKGSRWALIKNPGDLTGRQRTTLAGTAKTNARLYRTYLLKEQLRMVFTAKGQPGRGCSPAGSPGPAAAESLSSSNSPGPSPGSCR
jgi:transposase